MADRKNEGKKAGGMIDLLAAASGATALTAHLYLLVSVLVKQAQTGWTYGTTVGSESVLLWVAQAATIPFILFCLVHCIVRTCKSGKSIYAILSGGAALLSLLCWGASLLLLYC
ncbi:MAG: hypothetical protein J5843_03010 [Clostridia bacterium]|nr:hypothetical protein [Clostridia bacterium]